MVNFFNRSKEIGETGLTKARSKDPPYSANSLGRGFASEKSILMAEYAFALHRTFDRHSLRSPRKDLRNWFNIRTSVILTVYNSKDATDRCRLVKPLIISFGSIDQSTSPSMEMCSKRSKDEMMRGMVALNKSSFDNRMTRTCGDIEIRASMEQHDSSLIEIPRMR